MSCESVVALVMAAGYSRRFGAADKRLAPLRASTLLAQSVDNARRAFPVVRIAVRSDDTLEGFDERELIRITRARNGLGASIGEAFTQLARDSAFEGVEAAAVLLGDMPYLRLETLNTLRQQAAFDRIVVPFYREAPGHPVIFGRRFWSALAALCGGDGARAVLAAHAAHRCRVPVDDPGVHLDIDRPADLA
ncbi:MULTISPECIES: NTP transferase domain-containing protein [unclassified Halomonas]|uniref:nucleotidyltransferase family protein n=1 Tax=unclassified Halomonas TaxID=2609666 RepID=UPI0020A180C6|nr:MULTISPECIES: nucleotidyltransferase family protein [unclassified Halomonas]MCP1313671.1 nucleotidyltransferase family protein [Halomonas sp. 707D7]MCP1326393.1 nucleotidyltransferase family protein [Halomonas sp. 707D4]